MILRPTKHTHPDRTTINVAVLLLQRLRARRIVEFSALRRYAKSTVLGGDFLFLPAVNFLFLVGLVEYRPKIDSFEYVGPNETF